MKTSNDNAKECLFCNIVNGKTNTEILFQDNLLSVFKDINPKAPIHLLLVSKKHIQSINDLTEDDRKIISEIFFRAKEMAKDFNTEEGYQLTFHVGKRGGQVVDHLHLHLLGGF